MKSDKKKSGRKSKRLPFTARKEQEARAKAEEFWSDPCWQEPLSPQEIASSLKQ